MEALASDKLYYKIGEVAEATLLKPSILRYWETEFPQLKPAKSRAGQRLYTREDIELIFQLKKLLYVEKLTIEGARKKLHAYRKRSGSEQPEPAEDVAANQMIIEEIKQELRRLRDSL